MITILLTYFYRGFFYTLSITFILIALDLCSCTDREIRSQDWKSSLSLIRSRNSYNQRLFQRGTRIAIATDSEYASRAAWKSYMRGGNVIDAFIAASFVISVTRPQSTGLGGGGFALLRFNNQFFAIDFRERAPLASNIKVFSKWKENNYEYLFSSQAVATPGLVAGLLDLQRDFAKNSLAENMEDAIDLADFGFPIYPELAQAIQSSFPDMNEAMRNIFVSKDKYKRPLRQTELLIQTDLAQSLRKIRDFGKKAFYSGDITEEFVRTLKEEAHPKDIKFLLSKQDFLNYNVKNREIIKRQFKNYSLISFPLPSSGIYLLNMFENFANQTSNKNCSDLWNSIPCLTLLLQAMEKGFIERAKYGGDPDFTSPTPNQPINPHELQTTHISIMDAVGNMVVSTQSINYLFGSRKVAGNSGIVLNNTMDDFSRPKQKKNIYGLIGSNANFIAGGKTPLSSMSPTIVLKNNQAYLGVGAMGGSFIVSAILQVLLHDLLWNRHPSISLGTPRLHYQAVPDIVFSERTLDPSLLPFAKLQILRHYARAFLVKKSGKWLYSAVDPRSDGYALAQ